MIKKKKIQQANKPIEEQLGLVPVLNIVCGVFKQKENNRQV